MTLHNTVRLLATAAALCILAFFVFQPFKTMAFERVDSTLTACDSARYTDKQTETCAEALAAHDKAISKYPNDDRIDQILRDRAWLKGTLGQNAESMSDINTALELNPISAWAWYWRGRLNMLTGNLEAAISDYRQALTLDPYYCAPSRRISQMTWMIWKIGGRDPSALDKILDEQSLNKVDTAFANHLASYEGGPQAGALNALDLLIQSTDRPEYLMLLRARQNMQIGQYEAALEELSYVTQDTEVYEKIGEEIRAQISELRAAGNECETDVFSRNNSNFLFVYQDGLRLKVEDQMELEDRTGALTSVNRLIAYRPHRHMTWTTKGEILEQLGRMEEAEASYLEAIRLARPKNNDAAYATSPPFLEALFRLAAIYEREGRQIEARDTWDEALEIAARSVILDVQVLTKNAGHISGDRTGVYDAETIAAVHACLNDATCTRESVAGTQAR
ncbi:MULTISPECIES: tetratricopeptide repeat protein [unclassified Ruegeria]|uniref:tetratricopeptide repeat protein n=1 Tax=unclassified Ruegeria TaxID=2625375 RepID=UPI001ADAA70E|nr:MULTISPECIES: tetratricopeptide repeat protein [unclassified Ruegeria]MBO9411744.1 tetratricopeptide repeat protein [Ruegeria sp. R8_1]MBO9415694.1 tetratricopeptide repeat protein [Ruegeria sp. R8_2]